MTDTAGVPLLSTPSGPVPGSRLDYALRYAARGFAIFPLHWIELVDGKRRCTCGDTECRSPGKHPRAEFARHGVKDASKDPAVLAAWFTTFPDANIGLALGPRSGCFAIDVDPRNGGAETLDALQRQHGKLPETVMAMTGGGGQHYLFRWDGRQLPGKLGPGVDVKGDGGYIVVEPSMHFSGVHYAWEGSCDPLDGFPFAPAPTWIGSAAISAAPAAVIAGVGLIPPQRVLELRSALVYLDADCRDTWIWAGMALKASGAPNAFALWTEWSQLSEKFDSAIQRKTWNGLQPAGGIHLESIFARATERGWVNPASRQAQQFNAETERMLAEANGQAPRIELVPEQAPLHDPIPIPVLAAAGDWIESQHAVTHPDITTQTVLALAAAASARVYWSTEGHPAHVYLGVLAETVEFCRYASEALAAILAAAGCRRLFRGSRFSAQSSILSTMVKTPALLHVSTEWGALAQQAKKQPSGALDQALQVIRDFHWKARHLMDPADAGMRSGGDDQAVIYWPSMTLFAAVSTDQLSSVLRRSEMGSGSLSQLLMVHATSDRLQERRVSRPEPVPAWLVDAWLQVRRIPQRGPGDLSVQDLFGIAQIPPVAHVQFVCFIEPYLAEIDALASELRLRPLLIGAKQNLLRIVTALAPWANPATPAVTGQLMAWATRWVVRHTRAWVDRFRTLGSDEGRVSLMQRVLDVIEGTKSAGISRREIVHQVWALRDISKDKREELFGQLIADESITEIRSAGGRGSLLVSTKHCKKPDGSAGVAA